ncbi:Rz-like spanin [Klebsiella phage phi1_175008]|uniref:Rz-like spanin n=1 Tax=Klebsiella phage phi1_175008 TaxID=3127744 RepID=A0ACD5FR76_9CAUD
MNMSLLISLLNAIKNNKTIRYLVIGVILLLVIVFGAIHIKNSIYEDGYNAGVAKEQQTQQIQQAKARQDFDTLQAKADADRSELNNKIAKLSTDTEILKEQLSKKETELQQEAKEYAKTTTGSMSCFAPNDNGLHIINKSFPTSSH